MRRNLENLTKRTLTAILAAAMLTVSVPTDIIYADPAYEETEGNVEIVNEEADEDVDRETGKELSAEIGEEIDVESDEEIGIISEESYAEEKLSDVIVINDEEEADYYEAFGTIDIDFEAPYSFEDEEIQAEIPSLYDSRDEIAVTDIRNQGRLNTCWAFASMAVAETNAVKKGIDANPDYSERHLNYFAYNYRNINDPLGNTLGDYVQVHPGQNSSIYKFGGNTNWASWDLVNWMGGADESAYPYDKDNEMADLSNDTETCFDDVIHVKNTRFINEEQSDNIKKAIMEYGAVSMDFYSDSQYLNSDAYYCDVRMGDNGTKKANHSVAIIGWDDDFSKTNFKKQPTTDGAWLAKNSWGTDFGDAGYCWISYCDKNIKQVVALEVEEADNYDNNYYYDGSTYHTYDSFGGASTTIYSNVYTVKSPEECDFETLTAVGIGIYTPNTDYKVQVYINPTEKAGLIPNTGTPAFDKPVEGTTTTAGFYTIELPEPVVLTKGDKFAIAVEVPQETKVFFDKSSNSSTMEFQSTTNPGQSFYGFESTSGSGFVWTDMNTTGRCFRIHAYTLNGNISVPKDIETECISSLERYHYEYSGTDIKPEVKVTYGAKVLRKNIDYTVEYIVDPDDTGEGTRKYIARITGVREYSGSVDLKYDIKAYDITADSSKTKIDVSIGNLTYTGNEIKPPVNSVKVVMNNVYVTLKRDIDYTVTYENNINAYRGQSKSGEGNNTTDPKTDPLAPKIIITGIGNYIGVHKTVFYINSHLISEYDVKMSGLEKSYTYTSKPIEPKPTYTFNKKNLIVGKDYRISYRNNTDVAASTDATIPPTIVIIGMGNFAGTREEKFSITKCPIDDNPSVELSFKNGDTYPYTGRGIEPEIQIVNNGTMLIKDTDFTVRYYNNVQVKNYAAYAVITGIGNYSGTVTQYFNIVSAPIDDLDIKLAQNVFRYTGYEIRPEVIVTDKTGTIISRDKYNVDYINAIEVADEGSLAPPTVIVSGLNKEYTGSREIKFTITKIDLGDVNVKLDRDEFIYSGYENCPIPTLTVDGGGTKPHTLIEGYDYSITYVDNTDIGLATDDNPPRVIIEPASSGNFEGKIEIPFSIKLGLVAGETLDVTFNDATTLDDVPTYEWNGAEIRPNITVSRNYKGPKDKELIRDVDYTMTLNNNVNVSATGSASLTITGLGLYSGTVNVPFNIKPTSINGGTRGVAEAVLGTHTFTFNGTERNPFVKVYIEGEQLKEGRDYEIFYQNNINAGDADDEDGPKVKIIGKGNYSDAIYAGYTIKHTDINRVAIKLTEKGMVLSSYDELMSGSIFPKFTLNDKNNAFFASTDYFLDESCYTIEAKDGSNKKVGSATYIIRGRGNYEGEREINYLISGVDISKVSFANISDQHVVFDENGVPVSAEPNVYAISGSISGRAYPIPKRNPDNGYDLYYVNNDKVGTASAFVVGRGMYTGSKVINFKIVNKPLDGSGITVENIQQSVVYDGTAIKLPGYVIKDTSRVGENSYTYELVEGKDYKVSYSKNNKVGSAIITFTGMGNYKGTITREFNIVKAPIDNDTVTITVSDMTFSDGKEVRPTVAVTYKYPDGRTVRLSAGDYTVTYQNNISISTPGKPAKVTIKGTGKGNYDTGSCTTGEFRIKDKAHTFSQNLIVVDKPADVEYTGEPVEPEFDVRLKATGEPLTRYDGTNEEYADYKVSYTNNVDCGLVKVYVEGMNDYIGVTETRFKIVKKSFAEQTGYSVMVNEGKPLYFSGNPITPSVMVTDLARGMNPDGGILVPGKDYTLKYKYNIDASDDAPVITIVGKGNYSGKFDVPFTIKRITYDAEHILIKVDRKCNYNGKMQTPVFDVVFAPDGYLTDPEDYVLLKPGKTYSLGYSNNINAGLAGVTAVRKCKDDNVTYGSIHSVDNTFMINEADISEATVSPIPYQAIKNVLAVTPKPAVKLNGVTLKEGKDYTLSYTDNDRRGNAIVTITAADDNPNIIGSKSVYFYIR